MIPFDFATRNEAFLRLVWTRAAVQRKRPRRLVRAILTAAPGFFRHIIEVGYCHESHCISPRYGMAREQQVSTGHVWALAGTEGSGDSDRA